MYSTIIATQKFRNVIKLWHKQPLMATSVCLSLLTPPHNNSVSVEHGQKQDLVINIRNSPTSLTQWKYQRFYSSWRRTAESDEGSCEKISSHNIVETDGAEELTNSFDLKNLLYSNEDKIMQQLNSCDNPKELISLLEDCQKAHLNKEHIVQSIILLWMFVSRNKSQIYPEQLKYVIELLSDKVVNLNSNELSVCYLYLRKMGIPNRDDTVQDLLTRALYIVNTSEDVVSLPALSRLSVGINTGREFFTPMLCNNFLRHLNKHIKHNCNTEDHARMIATCMFNLQVLINDEMISAYKEKVNELLQNKKLSHETPKSIIKIVNMLNIPVWSQKHVVLIRNLLLTLKPAIKQLEANDLKNICRIYQYHMEPASLHDSLAEGLEDLLSRQMTAENLACFVPFSQPRRRESLINAFKALISTSDSWWKHEDNVTGHLFASLRGLKISDVKVCDAYWNGVVKLLECDEEEEKQLRFLRHCHRYMNFNNNLGGTYRHMALEKLLSQMCMRAIESDVAGRIPQKFARLASFVMAYGHTPYSWKKYPNVLLSRIITMRDQLTPADCFSISRGLQISLEMRYRHQIPQLAGMQLATIDSILTACIERHLNDEELSTSDLNMLVKTLSNRKTLKHSVVYHKTLQKYKEVKCHELNSRAIKDMSYNFMSTNYFVPEVLDAMFGYVEHNHEHVVGETVEKVLTCCYNLGYTPQSYDALQYAGLILLRDFDYMSGLALVQSCLALCFYKTIPEDLINKVFCVKFIQRVEDEIQMCYSKATYPERVLNIVMQLNRTVCLDFPEANVPWFQQNFIEAQMSKKHCVESRFSRDVKSLLTTVLKDETSFRCNHTTPYGYQIDFVINFERDRKAIALPTETTMLDRITKVAILLLKLDSFCENDLKALKGPESMKMKHLEMMGYKVLHINEHDWNSKYMNVPGAKRNYLKCLLQISN